MDEPPRAGQGATPGRRTLSSLDVLAIGINAIVGAGIYRLPGHIATHLGGASWLAFLVVGLLLVTIGLCFAEAASMFGATGGPYLYAREAFGKEVGFAVGWISWVTMVVSWAAVASGLMSYVGHFVPALGSGAPGKLVVAGVIGALCLINYRGIKPGAWTTNAFTAAKLIPLAVFVGVGAFYVELENVSLLPSSTAALGPAVFVALFAVLGFEVAPVPAGETRNPRRAMPLAVLGSLLGAVGLYVAIMVVATGTTPTLAGSETPLTDAATTFMGSSGAALLAIGAIVSMIGFNAGTALVTPRYLAVLAEDGWLPRKLAHRHPRFGSPVGAIIVTGALTIAGAWLLDFEKLVNLSNISVIMQYGSTCLAIIVLRRRRPELPRAFRLPGGPIIPVLGLGVTAYLCLQATWVEATWAGGVIVVGVLVTLITRRVTGR